MTRLVVNQERTQAVFRSEKPALRRLLRGLVASLSDQLVEFYPDEKTVDPADRILKTVSGSKLTDQMWKKLGDRLGHQLRIKVRTSFE